MISRKEILIRKNIDIPMRDGVLLRADMYRPNDDESYPVVLNRLPYLKNERMKSAPFLHPASLAEEGFIVIFQDCRGCGDSGGILEPFENERRDGYDTIQWISGQTWCNGQVGMYGVSYHGYTQLAAASQNPPGLKTICPGQVGAKHLPTAPEGVFSLFTSIRWYIAQSMNAINSNGDMPEGEKKEKLAALSNYLENRLEQSEYLPLSSAPFANMKDIPIKNFFKEWLENVDNQEYWDSMGEPVDLDDIKVPCNITTGWFDFMQEGSLDNFTHLSSRNDDIAKDHRLLVGPWIHGQVMGDFLGDIDFGMKAGGAAGKVYERYVSWFKKWLKGEEDGSMDSPVRIFVMGDNFWRDENEWPLERTVYSPLYLGSGGDARTRDGNGSLSFEKAPGSAADEYVYDPENPYNGLDYDYQLGLMRDRNPIEEREDMLIYSTEPIEKELEVTGNVKMKIYASSSAEDTDFYFTLVDVHPNGKAYPLLEKYIKAHYRNYPEKSFLEPNKVYEYEVTLGGTSIVFKPGHRIRLEITSSNFPKYARSLNTTEHISVAKEIVVANQKIFHTDDYPSQIILPVIPR